MVAKGEIVKRLSLPLLSGTNDKRELLRSFEQRGNEGRKNANRAFRFTSFALGKQRYTVTKSYLGGRCSV